MGSKRSIAYSMVLILCVSFTVVKGQKGNGSSALSDSVVVLCSISPDETKPSLNLEIKNIGKRLIFIDTTIFLRSADEKNKKIKISQRDEDYHTNRKLIALEESQTFKKIFYLPYKIERFEVALLYIDHNCVVYDEYCEEYKKRSFIGVNNFAFLNCASEFGLSNWVNEK